MCYAGSGKCNVEPRAEIRGRLSSFLLPHPQIFFFAAPAEADSSDLRQFIRFHTAPSVTPVGFIQLLNSPLALLCYCSSLFWCTVTSVSTVLLTIPSYCYKLKLILAAWAIGKNDSPFNPSIAFRVNICVAPCWGLLQNVGAWIYYHSFFGHGCISIKSGPVIHVPPRMNYISLDFSSCLTHRSKFRMI